jgi:predicted transcriptional regulator of viral defense system
MRIVRAMRAGSTPRHRSLALARVASRQHGVIAARQLLELGFSRSAIDRLVGGGRLHRLHAGVYAVGHPGVTPLGRRLAAVLAAGAHAVTSHTTAAALWDLRGATGRVVHVSVQAASSGARSTTGV